MSSELKVDKVSPATGTSTTLGDSGDTFTVPSGVTLDTSSSTLTLPSSAITGQTEKTSLVDADKFLISDSAASGALKYVQNSNLGGGQVVKLGQSRSTSSASVISFDNIWDDATYSFYKVYACIDPSTDAAEIRFRWHDSSGELTAAVYRGQTSRQYRDGSSSGTGQDYGYWGQTYATLSWATSSDYYGNAFISMDMFPRTYNEFATRCNYTLSTQDDAGTPQEQNYVGAFLYDATTSLDNGGFRFEVSSGNFQAHDVCIYGFKI